MDDYQSMPETPRRGIVRVRKVCRRCGQATRIEKVLPDRVEEIGQVIERACGCVTADDEDAEPLLLPVIRLAALPALTAVLFLALLALLIRETMR